MPVNISNGSNRHVFLGVWDNYYFPVFMLEFFNDLGFSQEQSGKLTIKSYLMMQVEVLIKEKGMTQNQAAKLMGLSRPRISDVKRGKIDKFTIDALVDMLTRAGLRIAVTVEHAP